MKSTSELRVIEKKEQLGAEVVYYSDEYERRGNNHLHWTRLYGADFELLEEVTIKYTNAISELKRIVRAERKNDIALTAYDLEKLNDDFYLVKSNEDTSEALKAICNSVEPKGWR
ncbi:MAG: hypothetical protein K2M46_14495 [Lachnospiraceae bacterium]|nr:hypothetical protein [Lachnospiraceae bacterium]